MLSFILSGWLVGAVLWARSGVWHRLYGGTLVEVQAPGTTSGGPAQQSATTESWPGQQNTGVSAGGQYLVRLPMQDAEQVATGASSGGTEKPPFPAILRRRQLSGRVGNGGPQGERRLRRPSKSQYHGCTAGPQAGHAVFICDSFRGTTCPRRHH